MILGRVSLEFFTIWKDWKLPGLEIDKTPVMFVTKILPRRFKVLAESGSVVFPRLKIKLRASFREGESSLQSMRILS
jgi:hypothetical protein